MTDDPHGRDEETDNRPKTLLALGFVVLLVLGGLFLVHVLKQQSQIQDCYMQGRTNCAPIDRDTGRQ